MSIAPLFDHVVQADWHSKEETLPNSVRHDSLVSLVEQMLSLHKQLPEARRPHEQPALQRQIEATDRKINPKTKRLRLSNNPDAIAKIKDMWKQTPRPSITGIAKEINYPKATTAENTKRLKEKGELADK